EGGIQNRTGEHAAACPAPPPSLTLRVLGPAAGLAASDLLALDFTRIARHEARSAQRLAQALIVLDERAGDAVTDRARPGRDGAAVDPHGEIENSFELH